VVAEYSGQKIPRTLCPVREKIHARLENLEKVIAKFIEGKRKQWALARQHESSSLCFTVFYKLKGQLMAGKIQMVFVGWARVIDRFN
jgi:hypothetical protein